MEAEGRHRISSELGNQMGRARKRLFRLVKLAILPVIATLDTFCYEDLTYRGEGLNRHLRRKRCPCQYSGWALRAHYKGRSDASATLICDRSS